MAGNPPTEGAVDLSPVVGTDLGTPMRDAFDVRSALSGAVAGRHDDEADAEREADRLNDQCRREGVKQLGRPMRYEVVPTRVVDERANTELLLTELDAAASKATGTELAAIKTQLDNVRGGKRA